MANFTRITTDSSHNILAHDATRLGQLRAANYCSPLPAKKHLALLERLARIDDAIEKCANFSEGSTHTLSGALQVGGTGIEILAGSVLAVTGKLHIQRGPEWGRQSTGTDQNFTLDPTTYAVWSTTATANRVWTLPDAATYNNVTQTCINFSPTYTVTVSYSGSIFGGAGGTGSVVLRLYTGVPFTATFRALGGNWLVDSQMIYP